MKLLLEIFICLRGFRSEVVEFVEVFFNERGELARHRVSVEKCLEFVYFSLPRQKFICARNFCRRGDNNLSDSVIFY